MQDIADAKMIGCLVLFVASLSLLMSLIRLIDSETLRTAISLSKNSPDCNFPGYTTFPETGESELIFCRDDENFFADDCWMAFNGDYEKYLKQVVIILILIM